MDVRNCKNCGKLFNYLSGAPICPACQRETEDKFTEVKQYIYDNPGCGVQEVSEQCEVSVQQIKKWVREERLQFSDAAGAGITCENCGTPIKTGRFCIACKDKLQNKLGEMYKKEEPERKQVQNTSSKMRFLNN